jgi:hypothetical protein
LYYLNLDVDQFAFERAALSTSTRICRTKVRNSKFEVLLRANEVSKFRLGTMFGQLKGGVFVPRCGYLVL